jgi:hypothetical protein
LASATQKKESSIWFSVSKKTYRELYMELDILLRSADRFFNIENLPSPKDNLQDRNFYDELSAVRDIILRIISILELIIPVSVKNSYWFQKFAGTKFYTDHKRDLIREELYEQNTPEKGVLLFYDLFMNLKGLVNDLLKTGRITYLSYLNIGEILGKEIRENQYLNPFKKNLDPDLDTIANQKISEIIKSICKKDHRKYLSLIMVNLFRFLRYLNYVNSSNQKAVSINKSLLILILIRSDMELFKAYVEKITDKITDPDLKMLLQSTAYQFAMESKRVYHQELRDILKEKSLKYAKGRIENSHGILKNLTEQSILQIAQFYIPDVSGEEIFTTFTERTEQSLKLRDDIFLLNKFLSYFADHADSSDKEARILEGLKNYMLYFESFTFRFLRYEDYEEFVSFFQEMLSFKNEQLDNNDLKNLLEKIHNFRIYLETTLRHIANRGELRDKPIDVNKANKIMKQYLSE